MAISSVVVVSGDLQCFIFALNIVFEMHQVNCSYSGGGRWLLAGKINVPADIVHFVKDCLLI